MGRDGPSNSRSVVQGLVSSFEPTVIKWYSKSNSSGDQSKRYQRSEADCKCGYF